MSSRVDYPNVPFLCIPDARKQADALMRKGTKGSSLEIDNPPETTPSTKNPCNKVDPFKPMKVNSNIPSMSKIVSILPAFFYNGLRLPKSTVPQTISILVAVLYLHDATGLKELPIYRHVFPENESNRGNNFVTSFYPMVPSDSFSTQSSSDDCFGLRDQNLSKNRYDLSILFQIVDETFPNSKFPWVGPSNEQVFVQSRDNYTKLVGESKDAVPNTTYAQPEAAERSAGLASPTEQGSSSELKTQSSMNDIVKPDWMEGGNLTTNFLAPGYIPPLGPESDDDKRMAAVSKFYLQALLAEQAIGLANIFEGSPFVSMKDNSGIKELDSKTPNLNAEIEVLSQSLGTYLKSGFPSIGVDMKLAMNANDGIQSGGKLGICDNNPPRSMDESELIEELRSVTDDIRSKEKNDRKININELTRISRCLANGVDLLRPLELSHHRELASNIQKLSMSLIKKHGEVDTETTTVSELISKVQKEDEAEIESLLAKVGGNSQTETTAAPSPQPPGSTQAQRDALEEKVEALKQQQLLRQEKLKAMQQRVDMRSSEEKGSVAAQDDVTKMGEDSLLTDPIVWRRKMDLTLLHACITASRKCSDDPGMASNCEQCFSDISSNLLNPNETSIGVKKQ